MSSYLSQSDSSVMQDLLHLLGKFKGSGLIEWKNQFLTIDPDAGYLLAIDPVTGQTTIINGASCKAWRGVTGLTSDGNRIWVLRDDQLLAVNLSTWGLSVLWDLKCYGDGLAWLESSFFVSVQGERRIQKYDATGSLQRDRKSVV